MTFRSDDEKDLLAKFLAWLGEKGLLTLDAAKDKQFIEEFLKDRKREWGAVKQAVVADSEATR